MAIKEPILSTFYDHFVCYNNILQTGPTACKQLVISSNALAVILVFLTNSCQSEQKEYIIVFRQLQFRLQYERSARVGRQMACVMQFSYSPLQILPQQYNFPAIPAPGQPKRSRHKEAKVQQGPFVIG